MPQHSITLESPYGRIKLVPPSPADDLAYAECRVHPTTRKYLRFLPERMTEEEARLRRASRAEDPRMVDLIIHLAPDGGGSERFAGFSGYFNVDEANSACEAGIIVAPDLHGKGLATEVLYVLLRHIFEEKGFHTATFTTGADNVPMQRWLEDVAGARLESERKEAWKQQDGTYADVRGYGILEWEWRDRVKARLEERLAKYLR